MLTTTLMILLAGCPGCKAPVVQAWARATTTAFALVAAPANPIIAKGIGYPPRNKKGAQARLMARRAAEVVAVRNLKAEHERKGRSLDGFRYKSTQYRADGSVEVLVEAAPRRIR